MIIRKYQVKDFSVFPNGSMGAISFNRQHFISFADGSHFRKIDSQRETIFTKPSRPKIVHPWFTVANWYDEISVVAEGGGGGGNRGGTAMETKARAEGYHAIVHPGFVNGVDPLVYGAPEITLDAEPPASDVRSSYFFGSQVKPSAPIKRVPGLLDMPLIPLSFSAYRSPTSQATNFFKNKYNFDPSAMASASDLAESAAANSSIDVTQSEAEKPWLGFCDLYLATARVAFDIEVKQDGFPVVAIDYQFNYNAGALEAYGQRSRLLSGEIPKTQDPREQGVAALQSTSVDDPGQDFIKISTVFVLKSGDWGSDPDNVKLNGKQESVFVQHHCFWNLEHRPKNQMIAELPDINATQALLPLVGRYSIEAVAISSIMEGMTGQAVTSLINENGSSGRYWT